MLRYPPPPTLSESLDWRGFCKNGPQNLERLRVKGQNLENKGVAAVSLPSSYTAFASAMIGQECGRAQGQMSHRRAACCGKSSFVIYHRRTLEQLRPKGRG